MCGPVSADNIMQNSLESLKHKENLKKKKALVMGGMGKWD